MYHLIIIWNCFKNIKNNLYKKLNWILWAISISISHWKSWGRKITKEVLPLDSYASVLSSSSTLVSLKREIRNNESCVYNMTYARKYSCCIFLNQSLKWYHYGQFLKMHIWFDYANYTLTVLDLIYTTRKLFKPNSGVVFN